jgi:hypothetical protein
MHNRHPRTDATRAGAFPIHEPQLHEVLKGKSKKGRSQGETMRSVAASVIPQSYGTVPMRMCVCVCVCVCVLCEEAGTDAEQTDAARRRVGSAHFLGKAHKM